MVTARLHSHRVVRGCRGKYSAGNGRQRRRGTALVVQVVTVKRIFHATRKDQEFRLIRRRPIQKSTVSVCLASCSCFCANFCIYSILIFSWICSVLIFSWFFSVLIFYWIFLHLFFLWICTCCYHFCYLCCHCHCGASNVTVIGLNSMFLDFWVVCIIQLRPRFPSGLVAQWLRYWTFDKAVVV